MNGAGLAKLVLLLMGDRGKSILQMGDSILPTITTLARALGQLFFSCATTTNMTQPHFFYLIYVAL